MQPQLDFLSLFLGWLVRFASKSTLPITSLLAYTLLLNSKRTDIERVNFHGETWEFKFKASNQEAVDPTNLRNLLGDQEATQPEIKPQET